MTSAPQAAFLGLGVMGLSMARNLLNGSIKVCVYNRSSNKAAELIELGARQGGSPADAVKDAEFVFTCLGDGKSVEQILFGPNGAAEALRPGAIVIDFTTIAPSEAEDLATRLAKLGIVFLDSPVTGGDVGARNGTLTIMVGGSAEGFERAKPLLLLLGKRIEHIGPSGCGQRMKAANQVAVSLNNIGLTEALAIAVSGGLDPEQTLRILGSGAAGSWALENYGPRLLAGQFAPGFFAVHMLKDLRIACDEARRRNVELPGVELMINLYEKLCALGPEAAIEGGGAALGSHALIKLYQDRFGVGPLKED